MNDRNNSTELTQQQGSANSERPKSATASAPAKAKAKSLSSIIWDVADIVRGPYKPHEYGSVILPFTVLRRLDCVLAPTKQAAVLRTGRISAGDQCLTHRRQDTHD